jgi:hypothetical protein
MVGLIYKFSSEDRMGGFLKPRRVLGARINLIHGEVLSDYFLKARKPFVRGARVVSEAER